MCTPQTAVSESEGGRVGPQPAPGSHYSIEKNENATPFLFFFTVQNFQAALKCTGDGDRIHIINIRPHRQSQGDP